MINIFKPNKPSKKMYRGRKRKKGVKLINSKKSIVDGITFDSQLEVFCYNLLKTHNIEFNYHPESYELLKGFKASFECYEKTGKLYKVKGIDTRRYDDVRTVRGINYTPDFVAKDGSWIIETKGVANESFPLRWKMFKLLLEGTGFKGSLFMPQNQKQIKQTINIILDKTK